MTTMQMDFELRESTRLEREFEKFDTTNPHVYRLLVRFAREWRSRHKGPCGIAMLYERARWEVMMTTDAADGFKLCNNHRAYYARKIMRENDDLAELFNTRKVEGDTEYRHRGPMDGAMPGTPR